MKAALRRQIEAFVAEESTGAPFAVRWWSRGEARRCRAMLADGQSLDAVRAELDCTVGELRTLRKLLGLETRPRDGAAKLAGVARLSREGRSDGEVAAELGCSRATVVQCRKALGLPPQRKRGGRRPRQQEAF